MSEELFSDREFLAWELSQQIGEKVMLLAEISGDTGDNIVLGEN